MGPVSFSDGVGKGSQHAMLFSAGEIGEEWVVAASGKVEEFNPALPRAVGFPMSLGSDALDCCARCAKCKISEIIAGGSGDISKVLGVWVGKAVRI